VSDYLEPCIRCERQIDLVADNVDDWEAFDDGLVCASCLTLEERCAIENDGVDTASCRCVRSNRHPSRMPMWASSMRWTGFGQNVKPVWTERRFARRPGASSPQPLSILWRNHPGLPSKDAL
jgi:hypothetical protein